MRSHPVRQEALILTSPNFEHANSNGSDAHAKYISVIIESMRFAFIVCNVNATNYKQGSFSSSRRKKTGARALT